MTNTNVRERPCINATCEWCGEHSAVVCKTWIGRIENGIRMLCGRCSLPLYWLPTAEQWGAP